MNADHRARLTRAQNRIEAAGYAFVLVDYCESPDTPGFLGSIRGVTDHTGRTVRVSTKANPTLDAVADTAEHELRHVLDPAWDCGNRDLLGRGAPLR